jgi:hypothetical protein
MTKTTSNTSKARGAVPVSLGKKPAAVQARRANVAQPAHAIITKLGGVRALATALGVSPAAVTRWQTAKHDDKNGTDGVIPEFRRAAIIEVGRQLRKRVTKAEFLKA